MKKSVYIVGGILVVGIIAIALIFGFGRGSGMMRTSANNSNTTNAQTSGNVQSTKAGSANNTVANLNGVAKATSEGTTQTVTTTLDGGQYSPIIVQKDVPLKWTITAKNGDINSCNNTMVINDYAVNKKLIVGENVIEFTPRSSGTITYSCWMGMVTSTITVVDDINNITDQDISGYSGNSGSAAGNGCSMCQNSSGQ